MDLETLYINFDNLWKDQENDGACWSLLASLDKSKGKRIRSLIKINRTRASQNTVRCSNELGDKIDRRQMRMNGLKASKCALEGNLLSSSCPAQVAGNKTEALIVRLAELQRKLESQSLWRLGS